MVADDGDGQVGCALDRAGGMYGVDDRRWPAELAGVAVGVGRRGVDGGPGERIAGEDPVAGAIGGRRPLVPAALVIIPIPIPIPTVGVGEDLDGAVSTGGSADSVGIGLRVNDDRRYNEIVAAELQLDPLPGVIVDGIVRDGVAGGEIDDHAAAFQNEVSAVEAAVVGDHVAVRLRRPADGVGEPALADEDTDALVAQGGHSIGRHADEIADDGVEATRLTLGTRTAWKRADVDTPPGVAGDEVPLARAAPADLVVLCVDDVTVNPHTAPIVAVAPVGQRSHPIGGDTDVIADQPVMAGSI